jgi:hypothetical protein
VFEVPSDVPLDERDAGRVFFNAYFKTLYEKQKGPDSQPGVRAAR